MAEFIQRPAPPASPKSGPSTLKDADTCQLIGIRSDGSQHDLGKSKMPPKMKAREIVRGVFGQVVDLDDDSSDAALALGCCEELIEFMQAQSLAAGRSLGLARSSVYLAGPMTGLPEFNYPAFHAAAQRLRSLGYHVENPAENPEPPIKSWQGYMRLALAQMLTCDCVALLPGWEDSRGARVEHRLANDLGLCVVPVGRLEAL